MVLPPGQLILPIAPSTLQAPILPSQIIFEHVLFLQTPWLLSLRGELVASLEDASLMGLYVDISATTVTVRSPRQDLLQRQEVSEGQQALPCWGPL